MNNRLKKIIIEKVATNHGLQQMLSDIEIVCIAKSIHSVTYFAAHMYPTHCISYSTMQKYDTNGMIVWYHLRQFSLFMCKVMVHVCTQAMRGRGKASLPPCSLGRRLHVHNIRRSDICI